MRIKKRTAVTAIVALLVCVAVYLNWSYQRGLDGDQQTGGDNTASDESRLVGQTDLVNGDKDTGTNAKLKEYFSKLRLTRQKARDEAIGTLESTTADETLSKEAKDIAVAGITSIANNAVIEARIESLILAKGYSDCAAFLNEEGLSIIVAPPDGGLKSEDAIRIKDIAVGETNVAVENIKIIEARIT